LETKDHNLKTEAKKRSAGIIASGQTSHPARS